MNTRSNPLTSELLNTDGQSGRWSSLPFKPCSRIAANLSREKANISFFSILLKRKLTKGIDDKDQFTDVQMFLIQALNGYHIEDKENEEVDVLDITSDGWYFQSVSSARIRRLELTDNDPAWGLCVDYTSE